MLVRVQGTGKVRAPNTPTITLTFGSAPVVGNAVIVVVHTAWVPGEVRPGACVDNRGNVYRRVASAINGDAVVGFFLCSLVTASAAPFTITASLTASADSVASAIEVSGGSAPYGLAVDKLVTQTGTSAAPSTGTTAALTADEVFAVAAWNCGTNTLTSITVQVVSPTWTQEAEELDGASYTVGEINSRVLTGVIGTTQSCAWTASSSRAYAAALVTFFAQTAPLTVRNSQLVVEVLDQPSAAARVSQVVVEVLDYPPSAARVSQTVVEVLTEVPASIPTSHIWMGDGKGVIWID